MLSAAGLRMCTNTWLTLACGIVISGSLEGRMLKSGTSSSNTNGSFADCGNVNGVMIETRTAEKRTRNSRLVLFVCVECEAATFMVCAASWCLSVQASGMEVQSSVLTLVLAAPGYSDRLKLL